MSILEVERGCEPVWGRVTVNPYNKLSVLSRIGGRNKTIRKRIRVEKQFFNPQKLFIVAKLLAVKRYSILDFSFLTVEKPYVPDVPPWEVETIKALVVTGTWLSLSTSANLQCSGFWTWLLVLALKWTVWLALGNWILKLSGWSSE